MVKIVFKSIIMVIVMVIIIKIMGAEVIWSRGIDVDMFGFMVMVRIGIWGFGV